MQNMGEDTPASYVVREETMEELLAEGLARENAFHYHSLPHAIMHQQHHGIGPSRPIDIAHNIPRKYSNVASTFPDYTTYGPTHIAKSVHNVHTFHFVGEPKNYRNHESKELVHIADIGENSGKHFLVSKFKFK
jgi:hypothetical protein